MKQKVKKIVERHFKRDYQRVKPVLERILPQLNRDGWLPTKTKINKMYNGITGSELCRAVCNHYFRTHSAEYEVEHPDLPEIHKYWYALLRDFVQTWARENIVIQKLHEDFGI